MKGSLHDEILVKEVLSPIQLTSGVAGTFADINIEGWDRALLVATVGVWNDSESVLEITLKNSAASPTSDAISTATFAWQITSGDSDDDEVWMADLNFLNLGLTSKYLGFSKVVLNADDTVFAAIDIILYERNGILPASQDHTVYKG